MDIDFSIPNKKMDTQVEYYPFWVFEANVKIDSRDVAGTIKGLIMNIFGKEDEKVRTFIVIKRIL